MAAENLRTIVLRVPLTKPWRTEVATSTTTTRTEVDQYGSLQYGDFVKVTREHGDFKILGFVVEEGVVLWVNLYGGLRHHEMFRAMTYDRIKIPTDRQLEKQRKTRREQ